MVKTKFTWWFRISNDEKDLEIWLNDGVNSLIEINHENFHMHLSNKLQEILMFQHEVGNKTEVRGLYHIEQAKQMRATQSHEVEIISCTEGGKLIGADKKTVYDMVKNGELKNYGNDSRYMVNKFELLKTVE